MKIEDAALPGVKLLTPKRIDDGRGFFSETYRHDALVASGIDLDFVQDNHSLSMTAASCAGRNFSHCPIRRPSWYELYVSRQPIAYVSRDLHLHLRWCSMPNAILGPKFPVTGASLKWIADMPMRGRRRARLNSA